MGWDKKMSLFWGEFIIISCSSDSTCSLNLESKLWFSDCCASFSKYRFHSFARSWGSVRVSPSSLSIGFVLFLWYFGFLNLFTRYQKYFWSMYESAMSVCCARWYSYSAFRSSLLKDRLASFYSSRAFLLGFPRSFPYFHIWASGVFLVYIWWCSCNHYNADSTAGLTSTASSVCVMH